MNIIICRMTLVLALALTVSNVQAESPVSLKKLESMLESNATDVALEPKNLFKSVEGKMVHIGTNAALLTEMAIQSKYPLVSLAGQYGLQIQKPDLAYAIALHRAWRSTNFSSPLEVPFLLQLTNEISSNLFIEIFSSVAVEEPGDIRSVTFIVHQIPCNLLSGWFFSTNAENTSATIKAILIDLLMELKPPLRPDQKQILSKRLNGIKEYAGIPRAMFFLHSNDESSSISREIRDILEDSNVTEGLKVSLLFKYAKQLKGTLDIAELTISEKEKKRYQSIINHYVGSQK